MKTPILSLDDPEITLDLALSAAEQISQRLRTLNATMGPSMQSLAFYTRTRSKTKDSIIEKTERKRNKFANYSDYSFRKMTDLVGFRCVTLYDSDLKKAVRFVVALIRSGQHIPQHLFCKHNISQDFVEGLFYLREGGVVYQECARKLTQKIIELEVSWAKEADRETINSKIEEIPKSKPENTYSSAHIIFNAKAYAQGYEIIIPVEFQIRTAPEDIWAEVNHKSLYKVRSHYVWSQRFEQDFFEAEQNSKLLKRNIERILGQMENFSIASEAAQSAIVTFPDVYEEKPIEDTLELYRSSFGVYLFLNSGDVEMSEGILITNYSSLLQKLRSIQFENSGKNDNADAIIAIYSSAFKILGQLRHMLSLKNRKIGAQTASGEARKRVQALSKAKDELRAQRRKICDLEILRLRTYLLIDLGWYWDEKKDKFDNVSDSREEINRQRKMLYQEFCLLLEDEKRLIRPLALIYFWKFVLSKTFNEELNRKNIEKAYRELKFDQTLPPDSVYRVQIPRNYADLLYDDATTLFEQFGGGAIEIRQMPRVNREIYEKLSMAIRLAVEAYRASSDNRGEERGDIGFGFSKDEKLLDALSVIECAGLAAEILKLPLAAAGTEMYREIGRILRKTNNHTIKRVLQNSVRYETVKRFKSGALKFYKTEK